MALDNAISWFEIPTKDLTRAQEFYERIFGFTLQTLDFPNVKMRAFPVKDMLSGVSGALVKTDGFHVPSSTDGPLIYLNGNPDLEIILNKVQEAGGRVIVPKTQISPENGFIGVFIDTEGNRIGLHSLPE